MIYYVIRHKVTGELMPQAKRGRGYSHWNPSHPEHEFNEAIDVPRLISDRRRAARCIVQWAAVPNGKQSFTQSYDGEEDSFVDVKSDGRKKEDLEVVEVEISFRDNNA